VLALTHIACVADAQKDVPVKREAADWLDVGARSVAAVVGAASRMVIADLRRSTPSTAGRTIKPDTS